MRKLAASGLIGVIVAVASPAGASAPPPPRPGVCVVLAPSLGLSPASARLLVDEAAAIWRELGVDLRAVPDSGEPCQRPVLVKPDVDALEGERTSPAALAWVPFVAARARRLVFLRVDRARTLMAAHSPGGPPDALSECLAARLLGRALAHELGHVLLNMTEHAGWGLMRARYSPSDILRQPTTGYGLSAQHRQLLATRLGEDGSAPAAR